jgi:hypothetical protein
VKELLFNLLIPFLFFSPLIIIEHFFYKYEPMEWELKKEEIDIIEHLIEK